MPLYLPPSITEDRTPALRCRICGDTYPAYDERGFAGHVADCYRRNEAEVRMLSLREKAPNLMGDEGVDVEFQKWHKDRGFRHAT